jgi:ATP-dependent Clp protease adaptor protein ClpS
MPTDPKKHVVPEGDLAVATRPKLERARRYGVVFYNDDYTTKWFVVHVLQLFFHMSETAAAELTMAVHRHGRGVAGVYSRDIAETKAAEVCDYAKQVEMPLLVTAEPEDDGDA